MMYHLFRRELKRIAQCNLARIEGALCVSRQEIPAGTVAVPVDDDDWFAPELARVLEQGMADHTGCCWPSRFLEVPISLPHQLGHIRHVLFPRTQPRWLCTSNNYAVVYGSETADQLVGHIRATRWFLAHPSAVAHIAQPLSPTNRSLASTTQLRPRQH